MSGYIGTQPVPQSTQTRDSFTATSGQTSFATGGYQSGYIDLYLNGIKLAAADYTATNNSDVVLAVGAATGDILEVVAYTAFNTANVTGAVDFTVTGLFTSRGIDDNADATAITIDSSENVTLTGALNVTGAVGIGTATSSAPLTVAANSSGSNIRLNGRSADGYAFIQYSNNADGVTNAEIGVSDAKNMQFYTNGTERMQISAAGELITKGGVSIDDGGSTGPEFSRERAQNLKVKGASGVDVGITAYNASNQWAFQLYGHSGSSYGFLEGNWDAWDIQKFPNGKLILNGNASYYLQPETTTKLNNVQVNGVVFGPASASTVFSETLDDYEQGSFDFVQGTIGGTGSDPTFSSGSATSRNGYTKIGKLVRVHFDSNFTLTSTGSGSLRVSLPFVAEGTRNYSGCFGMRSNSWLTGVSDYQIKGYIAGSNFYVDASMSGLVLNTEVRICFMLLYTTSS